MNAATILVVDDEPQIRRVMLTTLASQGYSVIEARSGEEALEKIRGERPDLILLDVNLPGISGLETCREIRSSSDAPIIMLTVRNSERDKVQALDAGADDYVVKPFGVEELMARIRAALRRTGPGESTPAFVSDDLKVDFDKRNVLVKGRPVRLTPKEFELLRQLVYECRQSPSPPPPVASCLGTRLRGRNRIPARLHQSTAKKNRARPKPSKIHPHRTLDRLPLRPARHSQIARNSSRKVRPLQPDEVLSLSVDPLCRAGLNRPPRHGASPLASSCCHPERREGSHLR